MHIYAFGSVCRGEVDKGSDVDMLACTDGNGLEVDSEQYSIYTYDSLRELWGVGNPFVWHLYLESVLVFSSDGVDFISGLGAPAVYTGIFEDISKFSELFEGASASLVADEANRVFNISCIFLAVRNAAMCYSIYKGCPNFSRRSALIVEPVLPVSEEVYSVLTRARLLSSRGYGELISEVEIFSVIEVLGMIRAWFELLGERVNEA